MYRSTPVYKVVAQVTTEKLMAHTQVFEVRSRELETGLIGPRLVDMNKGKYEPDHHDTAPRGCASLTSFQFPPWLVRHISSKTPCDSYLQHHEAFGDKWAHREGFALPNVVCSQTCPLYCASRISRPAVAQADAMGAPILTDLGSKKADMGQRQVAVSRRGSPSHARVAKVLAGVVLLGTLQTHPRRTAFSMPGLPAIQPGNWAPVTSLVSVPLSSAQSFFDSSALLLAEPDFAAMDAQKAPEADFLPTAMLGAGAIVLVGLMYSLFIAMNQPQEAQKLARKERRDQAKRISQDLVNRLNTFGRD